MRRYITLITILVLGAFSAGAQNFDRGYELIPSSAFVKKGTWVAGGTLNYSQHINIDHDILIVEDVNSVGYNISVNPKVLYMIKDNMGLGLRFSYDRSMLDLASAGLSVAGVEMNAKDCYQINHTFSVHALCRAYIPFSDIKRFAIFADVMVGGSYKQGKAFNAGKEYVLGTYETKRSLELAVNPGFVVFLANRLAMEMNVGLFGVSYGWKNQVSNQVNTGSTDVTSAGFMVNLLSLGVGLSYYFL